MVAGQILFLDGSVLYRSVGRDIYFSDDRGSSWQHFCRMPVTGLDRLKAATSLTRRLFRFAIHHLLVNEDSSALVFFGRSIFRIDLKTRAVTDINPIVGSRPLFVASNGHICAYGKYSSNVDRAPMPVVLTEDFGKTWRLGPVIENIRHIHGVFYDDFEDCWWLTSGDSDSESAIWCSRDDLKSFSRIVGGSQQWRAVQLLFTKERIFYGSDTPLEKNHIYSIRRDGSGLTCHTEVEGSVFFGTRIGDSLFFSTAREPSKINKLNAAVVWCSHDLGGSWTRHSVHKKDIFPMKAFQYGQVRFPIMRNSGREGWMSFMGTVNDGQSEKITSMPVVADEQSGVADIINREYS